ncbi:hypothetical protein HanXRQr2_Chr05g0218881 [Helianthus annuus]|nr:hypothetical protein HanXRQr2_Chr05g0218881 [Helianthus annuus]KAJ0577378.1 hypothetical protein HanIR_Chr05g0235301 [Helianthus annuus]KAJ0923066.1 hypothetical protein HanPSC8_Chr05g0211301 [Helianthus annuus]
MISFRSTAVNCGQRSSSSLSSVSIRVEPGPSQSNPVNAWPNRLSDRYALNTRLGLIMGNHSRAFGFSYLFPRALFQGISIRKHGISMTHGI